MTSMPRPPHMLPTSTELPLGDVTEPTNGQLTEDEGSFILDTTLKKNHREDANILRYIDSFIRCKNNAQASYEAGVPPSEGYKIRHMKDVSTAIQKLIDKSTIKYGFDASELMERTKEMVDFDPIMLQNPDGTFKSNMHNIPPEARRNIKKMEAKNLWGEDMNGVKIIVGELIKVEFYDKQKAIEMAGKEKDLFKNKNVVEHTVSNDMANILLAASTRGAQASLEAQKRMRVVTGEVVDE